jgi:hypothetical protein
MTEDDTIIPKNAYKKLRKIIKAPKMAYASGVERSRASDRHIGIGPDFSVA